MPPVRSIHRFLASLAFASMFLSLSAEAHPVPDIPVRGEFQTAGPDVIRVEVDPRAFADDPENEPYLQFWVLKEMTEEEKNEIIEQTRELIEESLSFSFNPALTEKPAFEFDFTTFKNAPLEDIEQPVMVTASWKPELEDVKTYQLTASSDGILAVQFLNWIDGKEQKINVLFPGEMSYEMKLNPPPTAQLSAGFDGQHPTASRDNSGSWRDAIFTVVACSVILFCWMRARRKMMRS